jgi:hypothetical protein
VVIELKLLQSILQRYVIINQSFLNFLRILNRLEMGVFDRAGKLESPYIQYVPGLSLQEEKKYF